MNVALRTPSARPPIVDRAALDAALDEIARAHNGAEREAKVKALLKAALTDGHTLARNWLDEDGRGTACARAISHLMDEIISALHLYVATQLHTQRGSKAADERLSVIAVGGYGRGTLAPGSDIDLLFLFPKSQTAWIGSVVEAILYVLWDLGLKVGHAVRGLDDCLQLSRNDITIRTSVLEARAICGDTNLVETLAQRFDKEVAQGT